MSHNAEDQQSWAERRRDPRFDLELPCRLEGPDYDVSAKVLNLSLGGAGIALPALLVWFDFRDIQRVEIEGIGTYDVTYRWGSSGRLGVSFNSREKASAAVEAFFRQHGFID